MAKNLFSQEDYQIILQNYYKTNEVKYVNAELLPLSENAEGFMGDHFKLKIICKVNELEKSKTFFVKTKPLKVQAAAEIIDDYNVFGREIFFYDYLLKEFENYGYDTSFAAKCYYSIPGKTLVLEDLSSLGYQLQNATYNDTEVKRVLDAVALFHAAGYAYEKKKSEELGKSFSIIDEFSEQFSEYLYSQYLFKDPFSYKWWKSCRSTINRLIDLLPNDEIYKTNFREMFSKLEIGKSFYQKTNFTKTIGHGDLWSNNMLFQFKENRVEKCCIIDYQFIRYFYPSYDVLTAIYFTTTAEFRKIYLNDLYSYYYNTLSKTITKYGFDIENILSLTDFYDSLRLISADALVFVAANLAIVCLPQDTLKYALHGEEAYNKIMFENEELVVQTFKKNTAYQKLLNSAMYDLYEALRNTIK